MPIPGTTRKVTKNVWNETVANLTLMALEGRPLGLQVDAGEARPPGGDGDEEWPDDGYDDGWNEDAYHASQGAMQEWQAMLEADAWI